MGRKRRRKDTPEQRRRTLLEAQVPYLGEVRPPAGPEAEELTGPGQVFEVATYNVHRWIGVRGGRKLDPSLAGAVIRELGADVIALQEVLRPFDGEDPVVELADELQLHLAFVATRIHRRGELGNAILSRWPMSAVFALNLSFGHLERRAAIAVQLPGNSLPVSIVATHLALVDRTRRRQVRSILAHPQLQGPTILLGDVNAWRRCGATRELERELSSQHNNRAWPASYPSARPIMALDRIYARNARVVELQSHRTPAARYGSDHLPVIARIELDAASL
jgi:endonuclease/exonuclease/phosphatase family metal-dependent hydrolase